MDLIHDNSIIVLKLLSLPCFNITFNTLIRFFFIHVKLKITFGLYKNVTTSYNNFTFYKICLYFL